MINNWDYNIYNGSYNNFDLQEMDYQQFLKYIIDMSQVKYYEDSLPRHNYETKGGINNMK